MKQIEVDPEPELVPTFEAFDALDDGEIDGLIERHEDGDAASFRRTNNLNSASNPYSQSEASSGIHTLADRSRRFLFVIGSKD